MNNLKNKLDKVLLLVIGCLTILGSQTIVAQQEFNKTTIENAMVKAMEWQEAHPIFGLEPTDWTNAAYYTGAARAHQATDNMIFLAALKNMGYKYSWKTPERYYHADDLAISYPYLYVHMNQSRKNLVDLEPTKTFIEKHLFEPNDWKIGKGDKEFHKILWWWCDALFMAPPVLVLYAKQTKDSKYLDGMHTYYMETYNLLYDKEEHLFARDIRFLWTGKNTDLKEKNGKKIFWSRGNGWVLGGLALMLSDMPKDYIHRDFYVNLYKDMVAKVKEIQPKDGLWGASLLAPESYNHGEVSGSGFFTFALAWGINNGLLNKDEYMPAVTKAWKGLLNAQQDSGKVGWVQDIGFDPKPASKDSWQNFGTGAFLLAGSEIFKIK
ncbi:glycoside hydrolase family 88/105 protein [Mariniflexile sp.]|uniref:glycoside hydrolase family 88/105 protein n=1 Tax=Mariniflexile sp. TaxID=1979402 RepID=UPI004048A9C6